MSDWEKGLAILFIFVLCLWGFTWMLDDWRNDGKD